MMRKSLLNHFFEVTKFKKVEKNFPKRMKNFMECTNLLLDNITFWAPANNFHFYYMSIAYPNEVRKLLKYNKKKGKISQELFLQANLITKLIDDAMNRFSMRIFKSFIEIPEISIIIDHYIKNNIKELTNIEGFELCIGILKDKSNEVIQKYSTMNQDNLSTSSTDELESNSYWIRNPLNIFGKNSQS